MIYPLFNQTKLDRYTIISSLKKRSIQFIKIKKKKITCDLTRNQQILFMS